MQCNQYRSNGNGVAGLCTDVFAAPSTPMRHITQIISRILICVIFCACNSEIIGNARLFTKCLFTSLVPLNPPPPQNSEVMDLLSNFYEKALKKNCKHPAKIANKLSENCDQTDLWTNGRFWNQVCKIKACRNCTFGSVRPFRLAPSLSEVRLILAPQFQTSVPSDLPFFFHQRGTATTCIQNCQPLSEQG